MLVIQGHLKLDSKAIASPNLCDRFDKTDLDAIGEAVFSGYQRDRTSRVKWERRTQAAMDLAMQVVKDKNFPWPGASNIAFPLVTIAVQQFHSRSYPAIIAGKDVVKMQVIGEDPTGEKTKRSERVSTHMSWQCLEEDRAWEEQKDRLLINLPIVGTTFTKTHWLNGKKCDETVLAQDLVLDYWAKSVETCPRKTHIIPMFRNDLYTRIMRGTFRDVREESWYKVPPTPTSTSATDKRDNRQGVTRPDTDETTPFLMLEQHVELDLDGDGYAEPYIITIEEGSHQVLRIVTAFDSEDDIERTREGKVISITRIEYFTKYSFIPSPDGGIYDTGFGVLLGPLNEATNSILNQLVDAGTMLTTGGGFLGRGAKIRGGVYTFAPLEWKRVDSTGDDLRKNIFPLPKNEPSMVLFQLLTLLINYVQRVSGTTDPMVGESTGQNTPAETSRLMVQEGMKIYSAIFKRIWRAMKEEFKKGYVLNGLYMPTRKNFGEGQFVLREDYLGNPDEVVPAADPNITSDQMALQQAMTLKQMAASTPGYDPEAVERRVLKALKIDAIDQIYPGISKTGAPEDIKLQIAKLKLQGQEAQLQMEDQHFMLQMQEDYRMNSAEIAKIGAEIENMKDVTQGDHADRQVAIMQSVMKMMGARNDQILSHMELVKKRLEIRREQIKVGAESRDVRRLEKPSGNGNAAAGNGAAS